jgi:hypothetical protein
MDEELDSINSKTHHFTLGKYLGDRIVEIARNKDTFEEGIVVLVQIGLEDYDICERVMKGELTLEVIDKDDHQCFHPIPDECHNDPEEILEAQKLRKAVEDYYNTVLSYPYCRTPAWRIMHSQSEIEIIEAKLDLMLALSKYNPRKAYNQMIRFRQDLMDESNERAIASHRQKMERYERNSIFAEEHEMNKTFNQSNFFLGAIIEEAQQLIDEHKTKNGEIIRAKKKLDPCNDPNCRYAQVDMCCYGGRDTKGCIAEIPELGNDAILIKKFTDMGELDLAKEQGNKVYTFMFYNYEYTYHDNARNQHECPHCETRSCTGDFIHPITDDKAGTFKFIGILQTSEKMFIICFECQSCFEKLYYHIDNTHIERWLFESPEIASKVKWLKQE